LHAVHVFLYCRVQHTSIAKRQNGCTRAQDTTTTYDNYKRTLTHHQQNEGVAQGEISRIGSQLWKAMPESVKDAYKRRSGLAEDDWNRDVAAYKEYCAAKVRASVCVLLLDAWHA